jgi:hypothetical protein
MSKTETTYQLGEAIEGVPVKNDVVAPGQKQGHKCCGGCCDVRRAVIIVNIVSVFLLASGLLGVLAARNVVNDSEQVYEDDEVAAAIEEFKQLPIGWFLTIQVIKILCAAAGIFGAIHYNVYLTGAAALSYCADVVFSLIGLHIPGLILGACFAYPHFFFIKEVRSGIMSKENYPNEEMSCCCV